MQRCGIAEVSSALESEEVALILALRESKDVEVARLLVMAEERGIKVRETSKNDMWRMSRLNEGEEPRQLLHWWAGTQMQVLAKSCHREAFAGF